MIKRTILALVLCLTATAAFPAKFKANGYTVNIDAGRSGKLGGDVSGPSCAVLHLDVWTTRWGHALIEVKSVSRSRKFFRGGAAVYGRGPPPAVSNVTATCQD